MTRLSKKLAFGAIIALVCIGIIGFFGVFFAGLAPISARGTDGNLKIAVLHGAFKAAVARGAAGIEVPKTLDDPGLIRLGAEHYANECVSCHGAPGMGQSPIPLSMRPSPQYLPAVVGQFTDAELYWILKEGVQYSAMPAWPSNGNFGEIWSVVAFLKKLPGMKAEDFAALRTATAGEGPSVPWSQTGQLYDQALPAKTLPQEYAPKTPTPGWTPIGLDQHPVARCAACHGVDGSGSPTGGHAPNLSILPSDQIAYALHNYATGQKDSGIMQVVATALSNDQIDALAGYYGQMPDAPSPKGGVPGDVAAGKLIATHGIPSRGVPACNACHSGDTANLPSDLHPMYLAGQAQAYLDDRLAGYADTPPSPLPRAGWHPMPAIASALTPKERADVAAYFASLQPGPVPDKVAMLTGDMAKAKTQVSEVCSTCHAANLAGDPAAKVPNLTGQNSQYLAMQLWAFQGQVRGNSKMFQTSHALSQDDINALAAYVSQQPEVATPDPMAAAPNSGSVSAADAQALAMNGDPKRGIPACSSCHQGALENRMPFVPKIAGQAASYLGWRLDRFSEGKDMLPYSPMGKIASKLTQQERAALAKYFASL